MKQVIAVLRLIGIVCFLVFFIVLMGFQQLDAANVILFISVSCFVTVFLLQLYRFYIRTYFKK